ncbi:MAG TPA: GH92 family glycosyl hydrolase [Bryobacteraceae bacterium]|jgi:predicted alpha-1,2-mannosidase
MKHWALALSFSLCPLLTAQNRDLTPYVNPFIGTDAGAPDFGMGNSAGNTPPGAAYPFGMALWSPDTTNLAGGYRYFHSAIQGFSLTHISGRGVGCYQDLPILPLPGVVSPSATQWSSLAAPFHHLNENASPGYYSVLLDNNVRVELTLTQRTGMARFTFPPGTGNGTLALNAGGSAQPNRAAGTGIQILKPRRIAGSVASGDCGGSFTYRLFFAVEFDRPFDSFGVWSGPRADDGKTAATGAQSGAYVSFDTGLSPVVFAKVGLSYVSPAEASANLAAENRGWDFDAVRAAAAHAWNARLNAIQVSGGTDDQRTVFYTALYHAFLHPSTFSDADGSYLGFDGEVYNSNGRVQYHNFAGWDTYRSQIPLLAMLAPETSDMMQSLVNDAQQDPGGGLPRWEHSNTNSGGMIGDSQDAVIAGAYALGARNFDTAAAFAAMELGANQVGATSGGQLVRAGLADYLSLGYVTTALPNSGSITLEYATDDFAISRFAAALGQTDRAAVYLRRAQNWRNLFHNGYLVPRNADGTFARDSQPWNGADYCEGSVAQYSLMVPFNLRGLFELLGGNAAAVRRLDSYFTELNSGTWSEHAFLGNEPSLKAPWAYNFAGAPYRTQDVVRRALVNLFRNSPGGMPGNDDLGTLSAWAVFASIGLYPHTPGVGGVLVGSPLFSSIAITLASGAIVSIDAPSAAADAPYVQSLQVNGNNYNSPWIPWEALANGATLAFTLANSPNVQWGADPAAAPPSFDEPRARPLPRRRP